LLSWTVVGSGVDDAGCDTGLEEQPLVKTAEERMNIVDKYRELGSYRAAARACGVDHKTVRAVVERIDRGETDVTRVTRSRAHNYDDVADLVAARVRKTRGRITAKRLLPVARAAGYEGSDRNFRRLVADAKASWRRGGRRYRPWRPGPGEFLVIDYGSWAGWKFFCAVLVWSRLRFVRFTRDERQPTTLEVLAECFEILGGVPAVVLSDRIACLRGPIVADRVVAHPGYVRFATHYGFRPDWCEAADPESKGVVENLVGYAQTDLVVAGCDDWASLAAANVAAAAWCDEVNAKVHSEIAAIPAVRLAEEVRVLRPLPSLRAQVERGVARKVDRLSTVRFGSARYSVPARLIGEHVRVSVTGDHVLVDHNEVRVAQHPLIAPGEVSILDDHYGGPRTPPRRAVRPRTATEKAFLALGPPAEAFLCAAAAAGQTRLPAHLADIVALEAAYGRETLIAALERALLFRRFAGDDVRAIIAAGPHAPTPTDPGDPLTTQLPAAPSRDLDAYALDQLGSVTATSDEVTS
jgi:transposase